MQIDMADQNFDADAAVLAVLHAAFAGMNGRIDPPSSLDGMGVADITRKRQVEILLTARDDTRIVGCVFLAPHADHVYLGKLAVLPDLHGRGIGRQLVQAAIAAAPHPVIRLQTRVELLENHATFARLGFVEIARTAHPGYTRPTSITMQRNAG